MEAAGPKGVVDGKNLFDLCGQRSEERGSSCDGPSVPDIMEDLVLTPEQEQQAPIGQVRHYSYNIKQILSHDDSEILPRLVNHDIKNKYYDSMQPTSRPPPELIAVVRKIDRKERSLGEYNRHYVVNYHLGRQTETNHDRPISCPHKKSVSMLKPKQRPIYPKNRKRDNKYHQTHVKSKEVIPKSEKIDKNKSFPERRISRLFKEIQANSYKLSDKVRNYNSQNDMIKEDTDSRRKGRKQWLYWEIKEMYIVFYKSILLRFVRKFTCYYNINCMHLLSTHFSNKLKSRVPLLIICHLISLIYCIFSSHSAILLTQRLELHPVFFWSSSSLLPIAGIYYSL